MVNKSNDSEPEWWAPKDLSCTEEVALAVQKAVSQASINIVMEEQCKDLFRRYQEHGIIRGDIADDQRDSLALDYADAILRAMGHKPLNPPGSE